MSSFALKLLQSLYKRRLNEATRIFLTELSDIDSAYRQEVVESLKHLTKKEETCFTLGETDWGWHVSVPLSKLIAHSLVVGATGAGKSYVALMLLSNSIEHFLSGNYLPLGILDAKGELAAKAIEYLQAFAYQMKEEERERFEKKIYILDFSQSDFVTPYNILSHREIPVELLVNNRIETISQIYHGPSAITARMKSILKYFMLLMVEHHLPITMFEKLCLNPDLVKSLATNSRDERLQHYFRHRFDKEPRSTLLGLRQRVDSLFVSQGVRLSLSAASAPDFKKLQDEGYFIIINVAGPQISRGTSEFLLRVVLSDIEQCVFRREQPEKRFLWCLDEAQVLYKERNSRENMNDLLTMARSFGTYFMLLTQSLTSAVRDTDIINSILANIRWVLLFRSTLRDAQIIGPAIPVTGRVMTPKRFLYDQSRFLTKQEELKLRLEEITHFPERSGYLWLRSDLQKALKIKTRQLALPEQIAGCSQESLLKYANGHSLGNIIPREQIEQELREKESGVLKYASAESRGKTSGMGKKKVAKNLIQLLEQSYLKKKGGKSEV